MIHRSPAVQAALQADARPDLVLPGARNGYSLLELLFALGLIATLSGMAIPSLMTALDEQRTVGAVRYLAMRIQRARVEAISRGANTAIRFVPLGAGYAYRAYVDGDGDGVRSDDIADDVDRPLGPLERLSDNFAGVEFGVLPGLPPVEPGGALPGSDPIRFGTSDVLSYSALGTSSSGSLYVLGSGRTQYVIRVFGDTGRTRILRFEVSSRQWTNI
jgi:type II secretory pathway pseudopilin PulG